MLAKVSSGDNPERSTLSQTTSEQALLSGQVVFSLNEELQGPEVVWGGSTREETPSALFVHELTSLDPRLVLLGRMMPEESWGTATTL